MENIRQAVERARTDRGLPRSPIPANLAPPQRPISINREASAAGITDDVKVNTDGLLARKIVTFDGSDRRSRPYDMLRTQVVQSMDQNGWKILGVTSPTPNCGKTHTAINLAFSIARQPQHSVVLADMDLRKPQIEKSFGLRLADRGVLDLLKEQTTLREAIIPICVENQRISVLPTVATEEPSELMNIAPMSNLLQDLRRDFQTVILDLPPMLSCDDVFRILPQLDCVLLVAAVGVSKVSEVEECARHLPSQLIRLVLNKSSEASLDYYY